MDISAIQQQIQEKIRVDHSFAAQQRDEESKIRFDLERSKVHLIEQYQLSEAKLLTELSDCKAHYEEQARVSEANWTEKLNQKQVEVDNLESKLRDLLDMSRKRIADKEKGIVEQLEQQERIWKQRIEEIEQAHDENLRGMQSKYLLEKDSHELAVKARMDAKEDQVRAQYDKKMKKYEAQLQEVMRNYHDKELIIHGSLDEARKEIVLMRSSFIAKEDTLREELASKDRIIITMQSKLHTVDDITKIADSWRSAANNLARMVVHACVSIQDVPPVPVPPKDLVPNIFQGLAKEEDVSKQKEAYNAELRAFHRLRKESVLVSKELISKTLRNSKVRITHAKLMKFQRAFTC